MSDGVRLLLCFAPMIALAIGGAIAFGVHSYNEDKRLRRLARPRVATSVHWKTYGLQEDGSYRFVVR